MNIMEKQTQIGQEEIGAYILDEVVEDEEGNRHFFYSNDMAVVTFGFGEDEKGKNCWKVSTTKDGDKYKDFFCSHKEDAEALAVKSMLN